MPTLAYYNMPVGIKTYINQLVEINFKNGEGIMLEIDIGSANNEIVIMLFAEIRRLDHMSLLARRKMSTTYDAKEFDIYSKALTRIAKEKINATKALQRYMGNNTQNIVVKQLVVDNSSTAIIGSAVQNNTPAIATTKEVQQVEIPPCNNADYLMEQVNEEYQAGSIEFCDEHMPNK